VLGLIYRGCVQAKHDESWRNITSRSLKPLLWATIRKQGEDPWRHGLKGKHDRVRAPHAAGAIRDPGRGEDTGVAAQDRVQKLEAAKEILAEVFHAGLGDIRWLEEGLGCNILSG
jgi:hypothetical protein